MTSIARITLPRHPLSQHQVSQHQAGMTLVEIMVALTLGLILTAGVIQFFVGNKQSQQVLHAINGLQENGRYAMRVIGDSIHAADHWGGVEADNVSSSSPTVVGIGSCNTSWILSTEGIIGYEGGASSPLPSGCVNASNYLAQTDAFVVRYAGDTYANGASANATGTSIWVTSSVGYNGSITNGTAISTTDSVGQYHYPYNVDAYYIRPCSNPSGAGGTVCQATDDNGNPVPTLVRLTLNGNVLQEQPLVPGVEQMQLEYGVDSNNDTNADFYVSATSVTAANWEKVTSVRIGLVVRADVRGTINDANAYALPGGYTYTPATAAQTYNRKLFTKVVQVRNRTRS